MQEVLTTNSTSQIMNQDSMNYIFLYLNESIKDQQEFLRIHSANSAHHSDGFNTFFDQLIYEDVCSTATQIDSQQMVNCTQFMGGILIKGLYGANVAYWDNMRNMATDFNNSDRSVETIDNILNSARLIENELLKDQYFKPSYNQLLEFLYESISYNFSEKEKEDTILFAIYIVLLVGLYFILWTRFIEATRHSLWVTKSMLAIIPLEIIQKVPKIKDFLLASSKTAISAFKDE